MLLLSHLINGPDPRPLLAVAARHLALGGVVIVQRLEPGRHWREGSSQAGPVILSLSKLAVDLPRVAARTTYRTSTGVWNQDWVLYERDDNEIISYSPASGYAWSAARELGSSPHSSAERFHKRNANCDMLAWCVHHCC